MAGAGNAVEIYSSRFVQHRTTDIRRPIAIIEQPTFVHQRLP